MAGEKSWHLVTIKKCFEVTKKRDGTALTPFLSLELEPYGKATCGSRYHWHLWQALKEAYGGHGELTVEIEENGEYHNVVAIEGIDKPEDADEGPGRGNGGGRPTRGTSTAAGPARPPATAAATAKELATDTRALICVAAGLVCNSSPGTSYPEMLALVERYVLSGERS